MRSKMPCADAGASGANVTRPAAKMPAVIRNILFPPRAAIAGPCHCPCFAGVPQSGMTQRLGARKVAPTIAGDNLVISRGVGQHRCGRRGEGWRRDALCGGFFLEVVEPAIEAHGFLARCGERWAAERQSKQSRRRCQRRRPHRCPGLCDWTRICPSPARGQGASAQSVKTGKFGQTMAGGPTTGRYRRGAPRRPSWHGPTTSPVSPPVRPGWPAESWCRRACHAWSSTTRDSCRSA